MLSLEHDERLIFQRLPASLCTALVKLLCMHVRVALTVVCGSVWLSCLRVGVEMGVEGLQWPSLPALGRRQEQGEGSSAVLSTHERMLCRLVRTRAHTSHSHSMHGAGQVSYTVSTMQFIIA